jgi:hypothetical protein
MFIYYGLFNDAARSSEYAVLISINEQRFGNGVEESSYGLPYGGITSFAWRDFNSGPPSRRGVLITQYRPSAENNIKMYVELRPVACETVNKIRPTQVPISLVNTVKKLQVP